MTYCNYEGCPLTACEKHPTRDPGQGEAENLSEGCSDLATWRKQRAGMTLKEAFSIFYNIDDPKITDEEKGLAILKVIKMETHNSVTKAAMVKVIRYLLGMSFELPEGFKWPR